MTDQTCTTPTKTCSTSQCATSWVRPRADVWAGEDGGHVLIELPGVAPEGLDVRVDGDALIVEGRTDLPPEEGRPLHVEWGPVSYRRTFQLDSDADPAAIEARLENGVLELVVPRKEAARPRRIEVRTKS